MDNSNIEWTDATVNFWWGCTKVGPGCDHCYAETWAKRTGGSLWGQGVPRRKIKGAAALIHRLDNSYSDWAADRECIVGNAKAFGLPVPNMGSIRRVFIQSMSDLFDLEVPLEWFSEAWGLIETCNRIDIQVVTKRISAVEKRLAAAGVTSWPSHVGLMVTVVNQEEADRDVPRLLALKAKLNIPWVGLSIEPMLGPISLRWAHWDDWTDGKGEQRETVDHLDGARRLDWVIVGGESGPQARPMHPQWAREIRDQCAEAGVPFFFKQWGRWSPTHPDWPNCTSHAVADDGTVYLASDLAYPDGPRHGEAVRARHDKARLTSMYPIGKAKAGRHLDGVLHDAMPQADGRGRG